MRTTEPPCFRFNASCFGADRRRHTIGAWLIVVWFALAAPLAANEPVATRPENRRCLNCHGQPHIAELSPRERRVMVASLPDQRHLASRHTIQSTEDDSDAPPTRSGLYLQPKSVTPAAHAALACVECHEDVRELPHAQKLQKAGCSTTCHPKAHSELLQSAHAEASARGNVLAPTCTTCHGGHNILPRNDRKSRTYPLNIIDVCGSCHEQHQSPTLSGHDAKQHVDAYMASVHGKAVFQAGLVVAATCVDCHNSHEVRSADDPQSSVHRDHIPQTCGRCHVGIAETYATSIHGKMLAEGDERGPVCSDCHTSHSITRTSVSLFKLDAVAECGSCHDEPDLAGNRRTSFYETYLRSYHGQVAKLGSTRAARCSDCHGAHDILPISDEASRLHPDQRLATCQRCHKGASARFIQFDPHADYRDGDRYPLLHAVWLYFIILMSCAFGFFGLHSVLWFIRSLIERAKHGPLPRYVANPHAIRRFTKANRINHALAIVSFFGLTLTGLPLRFSDHGWAQTLAGLLGGENTAGIWHRFFAIMLIGNFVLHAVSLVKARRHHPSLRRWVFGPTTMLPRMKDVRDCLGMFRWFFRGGSKPAFDRWTYWEKFDYVAEIAGSLIIGGSGLLLWFPIFFSSFLPGRIFNVAMIVHGYEALLAMGFIFTIHFFNAHLRLEKFPVDDVIFTGSLPEEEFKHERGTEYARLLETGELDALRVPPAPQWQRRVALGVGITAMAIGTTLAALIILAGLDMI